MLVDLQRLIELNLNNLEEGTKNRLMDPKDIRLLTVSVNRSIRLYLRTLDKLESKTAEKGRDPRHRPLGWIKRGRLGNGQA